jgi:hypothetical protein
VHLDHRPLQPSRDGSADRRVEPQRLAASLPRIPDGNDPLSFRDRLALCLGALRLGRSLSGCALSVVYTPNARMLPSVIGGSAGAWGSYAHSSADPD